MSELDDLSGYDDWELEILVQSYQDQIADLEEEIEGKQDAKGLPVSTDISPSLSRRNLG